MSQPVATNNILQASAITSIQHWRSQKLHIIIQRMTLCDNLLVMYVFNYLNKIERLLENISNHFQVRFAEKKQE